MQDLNDKIAGNLLTSAEWNEMPTEIQKVITNAGISLSGADLNQLVKSIAQTVSAGTFYTEGGVADVYELTNISTFQPPIAYVNGMKIRFVPGNKNTGASTVDVATLGNKNLKGPDGTALVAGILEEDIVVEATFHLGADEFRVDGKAIPGAEVFTSSGTFTTPTGVTRIKVTCTGGGGGGASDGSVDQASGGGAGATGISWITGPDVSYTVTVGTGGAGGGSPAANGASGTVTTFGSVVSAGNGGGGKANGLKGGVGGSAVTADLATSGGAGYMGTSLSSFETSGAGGASFWGGGGIGAQSGDAKPTGTAKGSGGAGGDISGTGGNGVAGICVVEWW